MLGRKDLLEIMLRGARANDEFTIAPFRVRPSAAAWASATCRSVSASAGSMLARRLASVPRPSDVWAASAMARKAGQAAWMVPGDAPRMGTRSRRVGIGDPELLIPAECIVPGC